MPWLRLAIGLFVAAQTMTLGITVNLTPPEDSRTRLLLRGGMLIATALVMALLGWPLAVEAARHLRRRRVTMELLFLAGIGSALGISCHSTFADRGPVYFEVVAVLLVVYSVGHAINFRSRQRAMAAIRGLTEPIATARRALPGTEQRLETGMEVPVPVAEIAPGDCVRVLAGELIPVDGEIVHGMSLVGQAPFTGEWTSSPRGPGDAVLAGSVAEDGALVVRATASGLNRRIDRLSTLIERAATMPVGLQRSADRFVRWFLPLVFALSLGVLAFWAHRDSWATGILNALAVLLVACPCAAGLATPLAVWSALGQLAKRGLVLHSGDALEHLAEIDGVIFDKTGTLADERLVLRELKSAAGQRELALAVISAVERCSDHPVAKILRELPVPQRAPAVRVQSVRTLPGRGVEAIVEIGPDAEPRTVRIIRQDPRSKRIDLDGPPGLHIDTWLDDQWLATATIGESLRESAGHAVRGLEQLGLPVRVMTGDAAEGAAAAARLAPTQASLSPEEKHRLVLALRRGEDGEGPAMRRPLYVGDGLNDAAAMAVSHVGIALAGGAQVTVETASATLHGCDLRLVPESVTLARRTVATIRSNLYWAVGYNLIGIAAAAAGWLHPVLAAILMSVSSCVVATRSFRATLSGSPSSPSPSTLGEGWGEGIAANDETRNQNDESMAKPESRRDHRLRHSDFGFDSSFGLGHSSLLYAHLAGFVGQAVLLGQIAGLTRGDTLLLAVAFAVIGYFAARRRWSPWADMTLAMISAGGLGMNLGWWADTGFASAVRDGLAMSCCAGGAEGATAGWHALLSLGWMDLGMLLFGVPAMFVLRRGVERFSWRQWCCSGCLLIGTPGMLIGMRLAGAWADSWALAHPSLQVLAAYGMMMLGMVAGMAIPPALEWLWNTGKSPA